MWWIVPFLAQVTHQKHFIPAPWRGTKWRLFETSWLQNFVRGIQCSYVESSKNLRLVFITLSFAHLLHFFVAKMHVRAGFSTDILRFKEGKLSVAAENRNESLQHSECSMKPANERHFRNWITTTETKIWGDDVLAMHFAIQKTEWEELWYIGKTIFIILLHDEKIALCKPKLISWRTIEYHCWIM